MSLRALSVSEDNSWESSSAEEMLDITTEVDGSYQIYVQNCRDVMVLLLFGTEHQELKDK